MNFKACLKLQNVSGNLGYSSNVFNRSCYYNFRAKEANELQDLGGQRVGEALVEKVCLASIRKLQNLAGKLRSLAILRRVGIRSAILPNGWKYVTCVSLRQLARFFFTNSI